MRSREKYFLAGCLLVASSVVLVFRVGGIHNGYMNVSVETTGEVPYDVHAAQIARQNKVKSVCLKSDIHADGNVFEPSKFRSIYVDDQHQLLFCEVPKVACTQWKRILIILTGKVNTTNPMDLPAPDVHNGIYSKYLKKLDQYSSAEIKYRIKTYLKFMFVREPLERLLSAYRNKFTTSYNLYFKTRYGKRIIERYRTNPSKMSLEKGHDVNFEEFVKYLVDPSTQTNEQFNIHWRHYYKLCHPCLMHYDVIGKYETLLDDVRYVLKKGGIDHLVNFPEPPKAQNNKRTSDLLSYYYRNISSEDVHKLWELYSVDYAMFGYPYPDIRRS